MELLHMCARKNLENLSRLLSWNHENKIFVFALPWNLFPRAYDLYLGYSIHFASAELRALSECAKEFRQRLVYVMPDDTSNLGSRYEHIALFSQRAIRSMASVLEYFPSDCVVVTSVAGCMPDTYDEPFDKELGLSLWLSRFEKLDDNHRRRIVLQNDPYRYSVADLLPMCLERDIPLCVHTQYDELNGNCCINEKYRLAIRHGWERKNMRALVLHAESLHVDGDMLRKTTPKPKLDDFPGLWETMDVVLLSNAREQSVLDIYRRYELI
jgi:UV DNA damage repair endonuclease